MKVKLSRSAAEYLRKETKYLKGRNPTAAIKFTNRIREAKRNIQQFPNMGSSERQIPIPGAQTWVTGEYLLDYIFDRETIEIITIRSGRMSPPIISADIDDELEVDADYTADESNKFTR